MLLFYILNYCQELNNIKNLVIYPSERFFSISLYTFRIVTSDTLAASTITACVIVLFLILSSLLGSDSYITAPTILIGSFPSLKPASCSFFHPPYCILYIFFFKFCFFSYFFYVSKHVYLWYLFTKM